MKKLLITIVALILFCAANLYAQTNAAEQLKVPLSSPGKIYTLNIDLVNGTIKVSSYEGSEILIDVKSKGKREISEDGPGGMKKISPRNSFDITAKEDNNVVTVENNDVNKSVELSLKIPKNVKLKLSTVNNGEIEVENVQGELELNNVNGGIKCTGITGSVVASTVNGNVVATFNAIDDKAPMAFTTLNGNVDVSFPATAKSNLKLKSERGEIFTDFDIDIDKTQPKTETKKEAGMYQLKLDDWIIGKINGGGPEVLMKNMNGNIYVRKSK
jgi:Putative adhesin